MAIDRPNHITPNHSRKHAPSHTRADNMCGCRSETAVWCCLHTATQQYQPVLFHTCWLSPCLLSVLPGTGAAAGTSTASASSRVTAPCHRDICRSMLQESVLTPCGLGTPDCQPCTPARLWPCPDALSGAALCAVLRHLVLLHRGQQPSQRLGDGACWLVVSWLLCRLLCWLGGDADRG